jgi:hypothetical protein
VRCQWIQPRASRSYFGTSGVKVHEPRLEQGAGHRLQHLAHAPVERDLVVQRAENAAAGALFGGPKRSSGPSNTPKFVILDPDTDPARIAALAGATVALGAVYWLLRERDVRSLPDALAAQGAAPGSRTR